jgi:DNA-binding transcriptional MocR family regulator
MTGYRLGYVAAPARLVSVVTTLQSQITSCAGALSQAAGVAAPTLVPDKILDENVMRVGQHLDKSRFACRTRKTDHLFSSRRQLQATRDPLKRQGLFTSLRSSRKSRTYSTKTSRIVSPRKSFRWPKIVPPVDIPAASAASRLPHYCTGSPMVHTS